MALDRLGLVKTTLVDYPDEVAATLFTAGCNFRCPYCHNPQLVPAAAPASFVPRSEALAFLAKRRGVLGGVCITGGEPLLHNDLPELVAELHDLGLKVKVDTNGSFPAQIEPLRADYIAMDIKCAPARYAVLWPNATARHAERIVESIGIIRAISPRYEFRTTVVDPIVGLDDIRAIAALLEPGDTYALGAFRPGTTLDPDYSNASPPQEELLRQMSKLIESAGATCKIRA